MFSIVKKFKLNCLSRHNLTNFWEGEIRDYPVFRFLPFRHSPRGQSSEAKRQNTIVILVTWIKWTIQKIWKYRQSLRQKRTTVGVAYFVYSYLWELAYFVRFQIFKNNKINRSYYELRIQSPKPGFISCKGWLILHDFRFHLRWSRFTWKKVNQSMTYGMTPPHGIDFYHLLIIFTVTVKISNSDSIIESHSKTLFRKNYPDSDLSILKAE